MLEINKHINDFADMIGMFLIESGGEYQKGISELTAHNIYFALGSGQYLIKFDGNGIKWFVSYWMIKERDIEAVEDRVIPYEKTTGTVLYITECGSRDKKGVAEIKKELRKIGKKGVAWHDTRGKGFQYFPHQTGEGE